MSDDELAAAIAVLHAHDRELLLADDVDGAFSVMRDKFVLLAIQNERAATRISSIRTAALNFLN